jgi:GlpG protein
MRLICTIQGEENPLPFSYYLASQGIENKCEEASHNGGKVFRIWVFDEDLVEQALKLYQEYQANPHDPRYHRFSAAVTQSEEQKFSQQSATLKSEGRSKIRRRLLSPAPYGPISILVLITVATLFLLAQIGRGTLTPPKIPGIIQAPLLAPIEKTFIFDYPTYFVLRDQLFKVYTIEEIEQQKPPSPEARKLIQELKATPVWMGIYEQFLNHFRHPEIPLGYRGALFEKIREGEVWRLFTPALLHIDLLHIFFNVLWFILLGNQIEFRLGWWRYLLLILVAGVVSNLAQYLVSGPFFMGLSGIVVGMAAFIWARQQRAPWEGYLLHRITLIFLAIFVIGMFLLQIVLFFLQLTGTLGLSVSIANTAHLAGALVGYLLGRMRLFAIHSKATK